MTYSSIGLIAVIIQGIINHDILFYRNTVDFVPAQKEYRRFLFATFMYYFTDIVWGILDSLHLVNILYVDTVIYYVAMASAILLWVKYVLKYLEDSNFFAKILNYTGILFFIFEIAFLIVNFFIPVFFRFDENGTYQAGKVRYIALIVQIVFFFLTSIYTFLMMIKKSGAARRRRRTVGLFGVIMVCLISIQFVYPLLPLYSIGYLMGTCLLHTFVVEDVRNEYRLELEKTLEELKSKNNELGNAQMSLNTDELTGVKSKHAYKEKVYLLDEMIHNGSVSDFAVAIFDINDLKKINDTLGHDTGDEYIMAGAMTICECFKHSPVYRIGGDEFVVILEGCDFEKRMSLMETFNDQMDREKESGRVVVSAGYSDFDADDDRFFSDILRRADAAMYNRKKELKSFAG